MLRFLADENFDNRFLAALQQRYPELDVVRVQDVGLTSKEDPDLLEWAAGENRVLITHDVNTIPDFAYERLEAELPMAGVIEVDSSMPIGQAVEELYLLAAASLNDTLEVPVTFLPL